MGKYYAPLDGGILETASGAVVAPGDVIELSGKDEEANKELIEEGRLLAMAESKGGGK